MAISVLFVWYDMGDVFISKRNSIRLAWHGSIVGRK